MRMKVLRLGNLWGPQVGDSRFVCCYFRLGISSDKISFVRFGSGCGLNVEQSGKVKKTILWRPGA